jgi:PPP family 3-phenylpropionic acid transporter
MDFAVRLAVLYGGLFGAIGIQLPFLPLWLAAKGLDQSSIGLVLALAPTARVLIVPLATRATDHFGDLKAGIVAATLVCGLSLISLAAAAGFTAIAILYALASAAGGTALPLTDAYALQGLAARKRSYGPVRLWGSAAFIAGTLGAGLIAEHIAAVHIIWVLVATYWLAVAAALMLRPVSQAASPTGRRAGIGLLLRDPALMSVIVGSALIQASHALLYGFGTLQWMAAGFDSTFVAVLWSVGVLVEIVLFAVSARFPPAIGPLSLMAAGAAGAALRWLAMMVVSEPGWLLAIQCLHALSFAATYLGAIQYVARAAPPGLAASAQGALATANGCAMAAAMALSGLLASQFGLAAYGAMAAIAAGGGMMTLVARQARS